MKKEYIPFARVLELKNRPDANLLLIKAGKGAFSDFEIIKFSTRKALEAFNKKAKLKPVIFTQVPLNCVIYAHQSDSEARNKNNFN